MNRVWVAAARGSMGPRLRSLAPTALSAADAHAGHFCPRFSKYTFSGRGFLCLSK